MDTPTNTSTQVYQTPSSLPGIPLTSSGRAGDAGTPTNTSDPLWLIYIVGHPSPGIDTRPKNEYRNRESRSIGICVQVRTMGTVSLQHNVAIGFGVPIRIGNVNKPLVVTVASGQQQLSPGFKCLVGMGMNINDQV